MASIVVFAGGFGSGKSEIALNWALRRSAESEKVILADLDLVNPYVVSRSVKNKLESKGVRVIAPHDELSFSDVPSIPSEILGLLHEDNELIIDLAGDEVGSRVMGFLHSNISEESNCEFYLVINPYRPFASNLEGILTLKELLESAAHRRFTGIISNPNLMAETNEEIIRKGHRLVEYYAREMDLPIRFLTVEDEFYRILKPEYKDLLECIQLYLKPTF
ncbi:MAG: hypothetical protein U9N81_01950 [Bacillota bacterium]|nr:hypothetical protein [Bacillota bacterium]